MSFLFYLFLLQGWQWTCMRVQISVFLSMFTASKHIRKPSQHVGSLSNRLLWSLILQSQMVWHSKVSSLAHTHTNTRARGAYVCLYGLRYKKRIFPYAELVFMTETGCVYCAARTKSWSILEANLRRFKGHAIALAVSFELLATEAWVRPHVIPCEIVVGRVALRRVLLRISLVSIIPTVPLSCRLHAARIRKSKGASWYLPKSHAVSEIRDGGGRGSG